MEQEWKVFSGATCEQRFLVVAGETTGDGLGSGEVITRDMGGGAKIAIAGRLKLRFDYRVFLLGDASDAARGFGVYRHPQRVSAGLSVAF